jgi:hypothetical protein
VKVIVGDKYDIGIHLTFIQHDGAVSSNVEDNEMDIERGYWSLS